jgi:hypothetical protein
VIAPLALALLLGSGPDPAPGCGPALGRATGGAITAAEAMERLGLLENKGAGGPSAAVRRAATELLELAEDAEPEKREQASRRFELTVERHCQLARQQRARVADTRPDQRQRMAAILERPEFHRARTDTDLLARLIQAVWTAILEALGSTEAGRYASGGRSAFFALVALLLVGWLLFLLRHRRTARRAAIAAAPEPVSLLADPEAEAAAAARALAGGNGRDAVRHAFRSVLAALERAELIPVGRSFTNRELVGRLGQGAAAPLVPAIDALARTFDRAVYGGVEVPGDDARAYLEKSRTLAAEVRHSH